MTEKKCNGEIFMWHDLVVQKIKGLWLIEKKNNSQVGNNTVHDYIKKN